MSRHRPQSRPQSSPSQRIAVIGAGIAGLACARTLVQAGHDVTLLEAAPQVGGRMASSDSPFGSFDGGAQYFTVRDARFGQALETAAPGVARRWSASAVRVRDEHGRQLEAAPLAGEAHKRAHDLASAVHAWRRALELRPNHPAILRRLGPALVRQGDPQGRAILEQLLKTQPNDPELTPFLGPGPWPETDVPPAPAGREH